MRPIKYRAWDKRRKRMVEVTSINFRDGTIQGETRHAVNRVVYLEDIVLMQYTGLKDKNGKEIYEGDLLNMHYRNESVEKGKVVTVKMGMTYDSDGWEHGRTYGWVAGDNSLADVAPYAEVLGNIYENPEILEEEE